MPLLPSNRPFDACALLAIFSDARGSRIVDGVLVYDDWYRLNLAVEAARGQALELASTRVLAGFRSAAEGWQAAQAFIAEVERLRLADPVRRLLSAQVLLDWGQCTVVGKDLRGDFVPQLPILVSQVPSHGIGATEAFLKQLRAEGQPLPPDYLRLSREVSLLWAPAGESETRLANAQTLSSSGMYLELVLRVRGQPRQFAPRDCPLRLGRDAQCAVPLAGENVSRVHGRIEFDHEKFLYIDESKNGSYVLTGNGEELLLRRGETLILAGEGAISPGVPIAQQTGDVVRYSCRPSKLLLDAPEPGDTIRADPRP
ncbi:MAG: FHA domain-containing protein [Stagnimonas sp.]|nr:FHA domain-containing protein [Stagnimonas sp.]